MRLKITFQHSPNILLPFDYQYAVQQWVYNTISKSDAELATHLHNHGYKYDGKIYKLFSFSPWSSFPFKMITGMGLKFQTAHSEITVSFVLPDVLSSFISGLFKDQQHTFYFKSGVVIPTEISQIEILPSQIFSDDTAQYRLRTGVRISIREEGKMHPQYIGPDHQEYTDRFTHNLLNKYAASILSDKIINVPSEVVLTILSDYKTQKINIHKDGKMIEMIGYKYDFELRANKEIHNTLYYCGAGEECSLGMGWVEKV